MKLEERQSALENEMNTAKDTIWRLTNRIFNLENEVGKLKHVLRLANVRPISANASSSKIATAKLAEIARRRQKDRRPSKQSASSTRLSNYVEIQAVANIEVKQEPMSDAEQNDVENVQPHSSYNHSDSFFSSHNMSTRGAKLNLKIDDLGSGSSGSGSSDYGSDEDYVTPGFSALRRKSTSSGNRLSVGRPIGSVWKHFKRVALKTEDGTAVMRAICRYCKQAVSPRSDRLKPHIQKCFASNRKESLSTIRTAKYTARKIETPKLNAVPKTEAIKLDVSSNVLSSSEDELEDGTATSHAFSLNRSLMRGRKKGPIWVYFDETWITMTNGEKRGVAVCKKCKKHLDKKTDRLRSHLKKCSPDVQLNDTVRPAPTIAPSIQTSTATNENALNIPTNVIDSAITSTITPVPESLIMNSVIVIESEIKPIAPALQPSEPSEVDRDKSDTGEESDMEAMFHLSIREPFTGSEGPRDMLGGMRGDGVRNPVWEQFRVVAVVGTESSNGRPSHIAFCNKCSKEVTPKTYRLQNHLSECPGANTTE